MGDYIANDFWPQFFNPNYEYQTPNFNIFSESANPILPCSPSSINEPYPAICAGCSQPIIESYVMKMLDRTWHPTCLKCYDCQTQLTDKCYTRNGLLFCRNDFFRRHPPKCAGCNHVIYPKQVVRQAQSYVYHLKCFSCYMCFRQLNTGDEFYIQEDRRVICKQDYDNIRSREVEMEVHQKRPRTSITSSQVDLLKTAYTRSAKPSRQTREQLAQETSLDMRVVQVWFQNKRAKEKRLKKESRSKVAPYHPKKEISKLTHSKENSLTNSDPKSNTPMLYTADKVACTDPTTPPKPSFESLDSSTDDCHTQSPNHLEHSYPALDSGLMKAYTPSDHDWRTPYQKFEPPLLDSYTSNYSTPF